jgi:cytohesin
MLHVAAALRQTDLARALVEAGADVAARDKTGKTPLHRACWGHDPPTVELLLKSGADANARDNDGRTPLHVAADSLARAETAVLLLDHGADPAAKDKQGLTPLETAATSAHDDRPEFLEAVIAHGVKPDVYAAAALGRDEELAKLLEKEPSLVSGGPGQHLGSPLHVAAAHGKLAAVRVLLDRGADPNSGVDVKGGATRAGANSPPGRTPLFDAVGKGHADVAKLLLERGARPDLASPGGGTALHVAAAAGEKCVRVLLDHGAKADARDDLKTTPLHWAAGYSDLATVKALVEAGADAAAKDAAGLTALDHANRGNRRRPEVAKYLLSLMSTSPAPATGPASAPSTANDENVPPSPPGGGQG